MSEKGLSLVCSTKPPSYRPHTEQKSVSRYRRSFSETARNLYLQHRSPPFPPGGENCGRSLAPPLPTAQARREPCSSPSKRGTDFPYSGREIKGAVSKYETAPKKLRQPLPKERLKVYDSAMHIHTNITREDNNIFEDQLAVKELTRNRF